MSKDLTPEEKLTYLYEKEVARQKKYYFKLSIKVIFYWALISIFIYIYFIIMPKLTPEYIYSNVKTVIQESVSSTIDEKYEDINNNMAENIKENSKNIQDNISSKLKDFLD